MAARNPAGWLYRRQKDGRAINGSGDINLAYTVDDVRDKIRIEGRVSHNPNFITDANDISAKFLYEGDAPPAQALAFLVPFFQKDNSSGYLVVVYDVSPRGNAPHATAQNLSPIIAVQNWLALADAGAYSQTWDTAAASFRADGQKAAWVDLLKKVRQPLGALISRKVISEQKSDVVPEMPAGAYYIVQFATSFAALTNAVETVEFMQESDGQWRAISYLIRPRNAEQTAAVTAAQKWLAEIDASNYAGSWNDASDYFQSAITQDKWVEALQSVRKPLGELKIRAVDSAVTETQLPGTPDGKYVVMQFETAFANKNSATETVTFLLEADGTWKACGYYIK